MRKINPLKQSDSLNILLLGNNPIELQQLADKVRKIPAKSVIAEIAFDLQSLWQRLIRFRPNFILIDDNIGLAELNHTVSKLSSNRKTRHVPIMVLKNSNYTASIVSNHVSDYLLKQSLTTESLNISLKNSFKLGQAREYLMKVYMKRKKQLISLLR